METWRPRASALAGACALIALAADGCGDGGAPEPLRAVAMSAGGEQLIPRTLIFGEIDRFRGRLSPDGTKVSWLAPKDGRMALWVAPAERLHAAEPIADAQGRGAGVYDWARNNTHIIFGEWLPEPGGGGLHVVEVATGATRVIFPPIAGGGAHLAAMSWDYPDEIIVKSRKPGEAGYQFERIDLLSGARKPVDLGGERPVNVVFDGALKPRVLEIVAPDGGHKLLLRSHAGGLRELATIPAESMPSFKLLSLDGAEEGVFAIDSRGRDAAALVRIALADGGTEPVGAIEGADIEETLFQPTTRQPEAIRFSRLRREWVPLTLRAAEALHMIDDALEGDFRILDRTVDDRQWIVYEDGSGNPGAYHLYDRETGEVRPLFSVMPELERYPLPDTRSVIVKTPDGLELVGYLTLPKGSDKNDDGRPDAPIPLMLLLPEHQGYRYHQGFDREHLWAADRGYAALSLNVRGVRGFGERFMAAGDGVWTQMAAADANAAARWAVEKGVTAQGRIMVLGAGLGGVAALEAAARAPDDYACATIVNAPLDLAAYAAIDSREHADEVAARRRLVGDPTRPEGLARLKAHGGDALALRLMTQVLIFANKQAGVQAEAAHRFAGALIARNLKATLVMEDLPRVTPKISVARIAILEQVAAACLGGRAEPIGEALNAMAVEAPLGADAAPGLAEALARRKVARTP